MVKKLSITIIAIRVVASIALLIGVFSETGIYTTIILGLILFSIETTSFAIRRIIDITEQSDKIIDLLIKGRSNIQLSE